jgi:urease accessory protein
MTELAQIYLGNIYQDSDLAQLVLTQTCLQVDLSQSDRHKGRIHAHTDNEITVGIIKSRDRLLHSGDVFKTESQNLLVVHLQEQKLLVIDFSAVENEVAPAQLVHLGHVLGNHHHPIALQNGQIYIQLGTEAQNIEKIIRDTQIPGLQIKYETRNSLNKVTFASHSH